MALSVAYTAGPWHTSTKNQASLEPIIFAGILVLRAVQDFGRWWRYSLQKRWQQRQQHEWFLVVQRVTRGEQGVQKFSPVSSSQKPAFFSKFKNWSAQNGLADNGGIRTRPKFRAAAS